MSPSDISNSDKGPMLKTSALETHYVGQFTSSTLVTRQNYFGCICCDSMLSLVQMQAPLLGLAKFIYYFLLFLGIVMYDNEFETKENKIWTKDKIELQHIMYISFVHYLHTYSSINIDQLLLGSKKSLIDEWNYFVGYCGIIVS